MTSQALQNKTIFITGGAKRIGAAMARSFHANGARLVLHYRNSAAQAQALAEELLADRPDSVVLLQADLLDTKDLGRVAREAEQAFGGLDVLINNASSFYPTPLGTVTEEQWDDLLGSNLKAPFFLAQALAPALKKSRGMILNMADIHGRRPLGQHTVYCIAKAGLSMLTLSLARELGPEVRVNAIAPGAILWPEARMDPEEREQIIRQIPLARSGTPEDIAQTALLYISAAPYITGQVLAVDGGRSLGW
jgi:pteridine reductase